MEAELSATQNQLAEENFELEVKPEDVGLSSWVSERILFSGSSYKVVQNGKSEAERADKGAAHNPEQEEADDRKVGITTDRARSNQKTARRQELRCGWQVLGQTC